MTYKDMVTLMAFVLVLFGMVMAFTYFMEQKKTVAMDFIELPQSITINPELK